MAAAVKPTPPSPPSGAAPRPPHSQRWYGALGALLVAFAVVGIISGLLLNRCGGERRSTETSTATSAAAVSCTPTVTLKSDKGSSKTGEKVKAATADGAATAQSVVAGEGSCDPVMRIHPQRAQAGSPLTLDIRGEGCAGRSGVLSITRIGSAPSAAQPDLLIVRRRIDVSALGTWSTAPLLVGQPPGSYRVTASCERTPLAEGIADPSTRRDLFSVSEVLELTGPAILRQMTVLPRLGTPGAAGSFTITGGDCRTTDGSAPRVVGRMFANADDRPLVARFSREFSVTADGTGAWRAIVDIPASEAKGSFSVAATCSNGRAYITEKIRFPSASASASLTTPTTRVPAGGLPLTTAATPIRAQPSYTG